MSTKQLVSVVTAYLPVSSLPLTHSFHLLSSLTSWKNICFTLLLFINCIQADFIGAEYAKA